MKKSILAVLCLSLLPILGHAQIHEHNGMSRPNFDWDRDFRRDPDFRDGGDGYFDFDGRTYVRVDDRCTNRDRTAKQIRIKVHRDDVRLNDFIVIYGNRAQDRLSFRENFRAGSQSSWKDLEGNRRCIAGFYIDAQELRFDRDRVSPLIEVLVKKGDGRGHQWIETLATVKVRDYNDRRHGRRGGNGRRW